MRVGIIGTGGMGNVHARHYARMTDVQLFAFDQDTAKLEGFANTHGATGVASFEALLDAVDVLDICLPTHLHREYSLQAFAAKKALLLEKPMARTVAECRELVAAADAAGVPFGVAHVVRYFPEHNLAHRLVKQGQVGTPAAVRMRRGGKAPVGSDRWFEDAGKSGGVILDLAIHELDWLRWTLGEVTQVYARSVRLGSRLEGAQFSGDYALITLTFESGAVGHVEATWMDPAGFRTTFEIAGSGGLIEFDSRENASLRLATEAGTRAEGNFADHDDPYYRQAKGFLDAVRSGSPVPVSGRDGLAAVAIAEAAIQSAESGLPATPERA